MVFKTGGIKRIMLLATMVLLYFRMFAQPGLGFHSIEERYNSYTLNPAFLTSNQRFTLSVFPFSGSGVGYNYSTDINSLARNLNSGLGKDSVIIELLKKMATRSTYNQNIETEWLSFTYRVSEGFWNFRIAEHGFSSFSVNGRVSRFMLDPDYKSIDVGQFQRLPGLMMHYREYSIGYSMPRYHQNLSFGFRAKLYFGKAAFSSGISGKIKEMSGLHYLQMQGVSKMSAPLTTYENADGTITSVPDLGGSSASKYLLNGGNTGFGIDLGLKYYFSSKIWGTLSIIDLGVIHWKNNLNSKKLNGVIQFNNYNIETVENNGITTITKTTDHVSFANELPTLFHVPVSKVAFSTSMPTTFYSGINYQLNPNLKFNITDRLILLNNLNMNSISATANFRIAKLISLNTGYALIGKTYDNVPLAVLFNLDFGQIYMGTDNLLTAFSGASNRYSGYSFGFCLYLFRSARLYDSPTDALPYHRPKRVKVDQERGLIRK